MMMMMTTTTTTTTTTTIIIIIIIIIIESNNIQVQNIFNVQNNITCSTNCKERTAATLYTLDAGVNLGLGRLGSCLGR